MNKLNTWLPFHFARVSAKQLKKIEQLFGSLEQALLRPLQEWKNSNILTEKKLAYFFDEENEHKIQQAIDWQKQEQQQIICLDDEDFPELLKNIPDPPILLYVLGNVKLLADPQIGIVGSRNASRYGVTVAQDFAEHLVNVGLTVTSGLASGIDKAAHEGALKAEQKQKSPGGGATIAVVGTGLDRVYPATNKNLAHEIAKNGAIVSEYPLGTKPLARHFPERNRIISGLSTGVLVVEATLKSGSLITARLAMEQGREVFAVPNSINSAQAKGCHQLIRQGAKLVESGADILEDLNAMLQFSFYGNEKQTPKESLAVKNSGLLKWIEFEPISLDELVVYSKMAVSDIQAQLIMLEMDDKIEAMSAGRWRRLK